MKINKVLFALFFCAGVQSVVIFSKESEEVTTQPKQSWGALAGSYLTGAKEKAQAAAMAAKRKVTEATSNVHRTLRGIGSEMVGGGTDESMISLGLITLISPPLLIIYGAKKILKSYEIGDLSEAEAVERLKKDLRSYIDNKTAYPTLQTKIDALKNPQTLLVFSAKKNVLVYRACMSLINEFEQQKARVVETREDKLINASIRAIKSLPIEEQQNLVEAVAMQKAKEAVAAQLEQTKAIQNAVASDPELGSQE